MLRHGGSQPRIKEGASHHARRGKNAEAFLMQERRGVLDNFKSIKLFQNQHRNPRIIAGNDSFYLGLVPVHVVNHGPEAGAAVEAVDQLKLIGCRACRGEGFVDDFDGFLLSEAVEIYFDEGCGHVSSFHWWSFLGSFLIIEQVTEY